MYRVIYAKNAADDIKRLERKTAQRIARKIDYFSRTVNPLSWAKPIKNSALGQYRFRIGDYRVIFDIDRQGQIQILLILRIKHRKDVYNI